MFDDAPLSEVLEYPAWFKKSFLDLPDDLAAAAEAGKKGHRLYFGQKRCPYCQRLMEVNFGEPDIARYTRPISTSSPSTSGASTSSRTSTAQR